MTADPHANAPTARALPQLLTRFYEWLWRGRALRQLREAGPLHDAVLNGQVARAQRALGAAAALAAAEGGVVGEAAMSGALALSLYREAAYWALSACAGGKQAADLAHAFACAPAQPASLPEGLRAQARAALVERDFIASSALAAEDVARDVKAAHAFVTTLLADSALPEQRELTVMRQRVLRVGGLAMLVGVSLLALWIVPARLRPDLAERAPWRTSSSAAGFPGEGRGGSAPSETSLFFHTDQQASPWIEFDLGRARTLHSVRLVNRADCCQERAAPLVIELSNDRRRYHAVAKRDAFFFDWSDRFSAERARYVRVRALQNTSLHLTRVEIH